MLLDNKEMELLKELDGNTYKVWTYVKQLCFERGHAYGVTREVLMEGTGLSINTVYKCLKKLEEIGLSQYKGNKEFLKLL